MRYRILPKTGPEHTVSYPIGSEIGRLLAAPAGSAERRAIREELARAGQIRHARAGTIVEDIPSMSVDGLIAGGHIAVVTDPVDVIDGWTAEPESEE